VPFQQSVKAPKWSDQGIRVSLESSETCEFNSDIDVIFKFNHIILSAQPTDKAEQFRASLVCIGVCLRIHAEVSR
jgi:hypothetical protein